MSSVSSVPRTKKVPKKKRELLLLPPLLLLLPRLQRKGPDWAQGKRAREGFLGQVTWSFGVRHF